MKKKSALNLLLIITIVLIAISPRIFFVNQTNYTAEDAFITFQVSRNISRGDGFSVNKNAQIYGSTTPLLSLLLAGWLLISKDIVLGSRVISILGIAIGAILFYFSAENKKATFLFLIIFSFSGRLIAEDMSGMEMGLLFLFVGASLFFYSNDSPLLSGVFSGLLLMTRIDAVIWPFSLFLAYFVHKKKGILKYSASTSLTYLPWVAFAFLYFGSPIPFTIIAKKVAYGIGNPSYWVHTKTILRYLNYYVVALALSGCFLLRKKEHYWIFFYFFIIQFAELVFSGATFFNRYFYLLIISTYMMASATLHEIASRINYRKTGYAIAIAAIVFLSYTKFNDTINYSRGIQAGRHEILKQIGIWIHQNSEESATVLLEPLGYVGFYADRTMIDEVGLVTPDVVDLHKKRVPGHEFYRVFHPDFVLWTCEEGMEDRQIIQDEYDLVAIFDGGTNRSCYEIRKKKIGEINYDG